MLPTYPIQPSSEMMPAAEQTMAPQIPQIPQIRETMAPQPVLGNSLFIIFPQAKMEMIKNNIFKVLQKTGTSNKTRLLHPIIEKNKIKFASGLINVETNGVQYASYSLAGERLNGFYINILEVLEYEDKVAISTLLQIQSEIQLNKSKITDNNDFILATLTKNQDEVLNQIVQNMNYFKLVDILYMEYLIMLGFIIKQKHNIFKVIESSSSILGTILSNLIMKLGGDDPEVINKCQKIMLLYCVQHFSTDSDTNLKNFLYKANIISEDEFKNFHKIRTMEDLARYLNFVNILNISPNSLRNNIKNVIGDQGLLYLEGNKIENLFAYLIVNKTQNHLFTTYLTTNTYKEKISSLEILVMNAKSYISF